MKITKLETLLVAVGAKNCIFVVMETDEGITGYGETVVKRKSKAVEAGIHELSRYLVGKDPRSIEEHYEKMYRDAFWVGGTMQAAPLSAVELAMWDILGKSLDVPVYRLLGGPTRNKIPVYCHCAAGSTPEEFAQNALACVAGGYRAMKCTLPLFYGSQSSVKLSSSEDRGNFGYSGTWGEYDRSLKETEMLPPDTFKRIKDYFSAAREAVGPQVHLMVDCHGRLNTSNAIRLCEVLSEFDLQFVEEPVPPENVDALREVTERSPVPIAAGERWSSLYAARPFLRDRAVAIAQPDIVVCGGLSQARKIAAVAESEYIGLAPHNPNGPLCTAASLHLAASIPNFLILETIGSEQDREMQAGVSGPALKFEDGCLLVPEGPGLGVNLDVDSCRRHPYQPFEGWR